MNAPPMMVDIQRSMIGHGAVVLLIGMLAGVGLLASLLGGLEVWPGTVLPFQVPGSTDAWVRTHLGGLLNAFLIMLVALTLPVLGFHARRARHLGWMLVGTGWANTLFYWAALLSPNRALSFGDNRLGASTLSAIVGLAPALTFTVVSIVAVLLLARQAFR